MFLLRDEYVGNTDLVMRIIRDFNFGFLHCLCQWVCCPETGDLVISFYTNDGKKEVKM